MLPWIEGAADLCKLDWINQFGKFGKLDWKIFVKQNITKVFEVFDVFCRTSMSYIRATQIEKTLFEDSIQQFITC